MKRSNVLPMLLTAGFAIASFVFLQFSKETMYSSEKGGYEEKEGEGANAYREYMNQLRINPETGTLTMDDIIAGRKEVQAALQVAGTRGGSLLNLAWESMGPNNVGGRTRAIAFDKDDPTRMYAGGVAGGLFISENGGLDWSPSPANETLEALSITSIAVAADGAIYIGGGEGQTGYFDGSQSFTPGFRGNGVYKSTDHGISFTILPETEPTPGTLGGIADWAIINRIACHPTDANKIVVAHNGGLSYSNDGGTTWDFGTVTGPMSSFGALDVAFASDGTVHASYNNKYHTSSSSDISTYTQVGGGLPSVGTSGRLLLAVAPSDPNYCYVIATGGSELTGIYRSTDRGLNFSTISTAGSTFFFPLNGQGYYNLCIAVNPADRDLVYAGGTYYTYNWQASIGSWNVMSFWAYPEYFSKYIHADQHFFAFRPDNPDIMYIGSDGGVSRTLNARDNSPDFQIVNTGYNTFQIFGMGFGLFGNPVGGSQDNGTQYVDFLGSSSRQAKGIIGGDGGRAEVSRIRPDYVFGAIYFGELRRSVNGGSSSGGIFDCNIDKTGGTGTGCAPDGLPDNGAEFVTNFKLWENWDLYVTFKDVLYGGSVEYPAGSGNFYVLNDEVEYEGRTIALTRSGLSESRLLLASGTNLWLTTGALFNSTQAPEWFKVQASTLGTVTAIEYDNSGNTVFIGTQTGRLYRLDGILTADYTYIDDVFTPSTAGISSYLYPEIFAVGGSSARITGISINRDNPNEIAVSTAGYGIDDNVFYSDNALDNDAATFTSIADGLPNIPVYSILIEEYDSDKVLAATEFGVWSYSISAGGDWTQENSVIGSVPVLDMREGFIREKDCKAIYLGTHGIGFFRTTTLASGDCDFSLVNDSAAVASDSPIQEEIIAGIVIAPNPADTYTEITLTLTESTSVTTKLYTMGGLLVRNFGTVARTAGANRYNIDVSTVSTGTYLVSFEIDGAVYSKKITII